MVIIIKRFKNIKDKNKGYISIEIIILMTIMFITGMLIMGKWLKPGQDAVKQEETVFSTVLHNAGTPYQPVDPHPFPGGGGGNSQPSDGKTYELVDTQTFKSIISSIGGDVGKIHFVDVIKPSTGVTEIVGLDLDNDGGIVGWYTEYEISHTREDGAVFKKIVKDVYISSQISTQKIIVSDTDASSMFSGPSFVCTEYYEVNLLDVSKVTNMSHMFDVPTSPIIDKFIVKGLNTWDMSNVTSINSMFKHTGQSSKTWDIGDISSWDTSNITDMRMIFMSSCMRAKECNIGNIGKWNVSKVEQMALMFANFGAQSREKTYIGDLSNWDVSSVTNMQSMFLGFGKRTPNMNIGDISKWNVGNVTNMKSVFNGFGALSNPFTLNLTGWDTSKVTTMESMFEGIGANKIMLPKNINPTIVMTDVTNKVWYDETDNYKEYAAGTIPTGNPTSHTLVDTKPI